MVGMRRTGGVFHLLREYRWNIEATGFTVAYRTPLRLERHNRGLRRRERMGTVGTDHNLPALLQKHGQATIGQKLAPLAGFEPAT